MVCVLLSNTIYQFCFSRQIPKKVPKKHCHRVAKETCKEVPKKIPKEHCQQVPKKKCHDVPIKVPKFLPEELLGLMFLYDTEDGQKVHMKIVRKIHD